MSERHIIVISNFWHQPGIKITFKHDHEQPQGSIHVECDARDLLLGMLEEMDHPSKLWTRKRMNQEVYKAYLAALEKIKQSTNAVM